MHPRSAVLLILSIVAGEAVYAQEKSFPLSTEAYVLGKIACEKLDDPACTARIEQRRPNWTIIPTKDPITDEYSVTMMRGANPSIIADTDEPTLMINCNKERLLSGVAFEGRWSDGPVDVAVRVDEGPVEVQTWHRKDNYILTKGPSFVRSIWRSAKVALRATDKDGRTHTYVFPTDRLSVEGIWLIETCPNQRLPVPESAGDIDTR